MSDDFIAQHDSYSAVKNFVQSFQPYVEMVCFIEIIKSDSEITAKHPITDTVEFYIDHRSLFFSINSNAFYHPYLGSTTSVNSNEVNCSIEENVLTIQVNEEVKLLITKKI